MCRPGSVESTTPRFGSCVVTEVRHYCLSCAKFTVRVTVVGGIVTDTAPITQKFHGQPFGKLVAWATRLGGMRVEELEGERCVQ